MAKRGHDQERGGAASLARELGIDERPVIVVGMHRSGTTMLASLLSGAGVFLGRELTRNHESLFFQRVNKDALDFFGCSWAEVRNLPDPAALGSDYTTFRANTRRAIATGLLAGHFGSSAVEPGRVWGWKDPRTCLTLPLFLELFPAARVLFIHREPADVALSLVLRDRSRHDRPGAADEGRERRQYRRYLNLCAEYTARVRSAQPAARLWAETSYEGFVAAPAARLRELLAALELPPPRDIDALVREVRPDRLGSSRGPEGARFRDLVSPPQQADAADDPGERPALDLAAGARHYRAFVGPPERYDLIAALQLNLLTFLGLREQHHLLDIGCGSLRGGRLFIPYLLPGRYFGVEPERWLVASGIEHELGEDILRVKRPVFRHVSDFSFAPLGARFDFILAHSIFSHAGAADIRKCLAAAREVLAPEGLIVATYVRGPADHEGEAWVYPQCVRYREESVRAMARGAGLSLLPVEWPHPKQQWLVFFHPGREAEVGALLRQGTGTGPAAV